MAWLNALSFSAPALLIGLLALPAIWVLFRASPPAPRTQRFPPYDILKALNKTAETPQRTPWPLLVLRMALAAAAIIALSGPILNAPKPAPGGGPLVFVVDDSFAAADHWRLRREALLLGAGEAAAANRPVFLVTTAGETLVENAGPMSGAEAKARFEALEPKSWPADRARAGAALNALSEGALRGGAELRWLSDGVASAGDDAFWDSLDSDFATTIFAPAGEAVMIVRASPAGGRAWRVERLAASGAVDGALAARARNGRLLGVAPFTIPAGARSVDVAIDLPLALRNDIAATAIEGVRSAGAVHLADARNRRLLIGLVANDVGSADSLLSGLHYVRKALAPFAEFEERALEDLLRPDVSAIILDDIGTLRERDAASVSEWIESGGVLIRFAGDTLAAAAEAGAVALTPTPLRGGRAVGGALSWASPQALTGFSPAGPFADMSAPDDVLIRRQVLAEPGAANETNAWASLADGTPLVTGAARGAGVVALVHVTATPAWSDLPLSATFVEMLRRLSFMSTLGAKTGADEARYAPNRILDGFGAFRAPDAQTPPVTLEAAARGANLAAPAGLYGAPQSPIAVNALAADARFEPIDFGARPTAPYGGAAPVRLAAPFLFAAAMLLILDGLATLFFAGRWPRLRARAAAALWLLVFAPFDPRGARAEPLDPPIGEAAIRAALETRLAYVRTGDPGLDLISERGLAALTEELAARSSLEPASPAAIDPETDDLSVYAFLYWPIAADMPDPSDAALANIESFMRFGGLLVFDTRDDERAGAPTPEREALRRVLERLNIPPLSPVGDNHVLSRSFYLLPELYGRLEGGVVWAESAGEENDAVTPLIIGGRDWAGAWARTPQGDPMRPMATAGSGARERAYRAGVNMAMVAFTGSYKTDQLHTATLLKRLGE